MQGTPTDWSLDGRFVSYDMLDPKTQLDIWLLPMTGNEEPRPLLNTRFKEMQCQFSPDGRLIAYAPMNPADMRSTSGRSPQRQFNGRFPTALSSDGSKILGSSRYSRSGAGAIALDARGGVYLAGGTGTTAFLTTPRASQTQYAGGISNAFAAKFDFTQPAAPELSCVVNGASMRIGIGNIFGTLDGAVAAGEVVTLSDMTSLPAPD